MKLTRDPDVPASAETLVSLRKVKEYAGLTDDDDDALLNDMIAAVWELLDGPDSYLNRSVVEQGLILTLDSFPPPGLSIRLPCPPVRSVTLVEYTDRDGETVEWHTTDKPALYLWERLDLAYIAPRDGSWPSDLGDGPDTVTIKYLTGEKQPPVRLCIAARGLVQNLYDQREVDIYGRLAQVAMNPAFDRLVSEYILHGDRDLPG